MMNQSYMTLIHIKLEKIDNFKKGRKLAKNMISVVMGVLLVLKDLDI